MAPPSQVLVRPKGENKVKEGVKNNFNWKWLDEKFDLDIAYAGEKTYTMY